jgi:hypothetical protein
MAGWFGQGGLSGRGRSWRFRWRRWGGGLRGEQGQEKMRLREALGLFEFGRRLTWGGQLRQDLTMSYNVKYAHCEDRFDHAAA